MLTCRTYVDVLLDPLRNGAQSGGVYFGGSLLQGAMLYRGPNADAVIMPRERPEPEQKIDDHAIYAGFGSWHFGHFILEGLARLWLTSKLPRTPIVWMTPHEQYVAWQKEIIALLEVRNPTIFLKQRPTVISELTVPSPGLVMRSHYDADHLAWLAKIWCRPEPGLRVWLSRTRLPEKAGGIDNESEVESELEARGWTIFHPQEHDLLIQVDMLSRAERIAGPLGSAFHTLVFLKNCTARIDILSRGDVWGPYEDIGRHKGFNQTIHTIPHVVTRDAPISELGIRRHRWTEPKRILEMLS